MAISVVQTKTNVGTTGTTLNVTITATVAGNTLIVCEAEYGSTTSNPAVSVAAGATALTNVNQSQDISGHASSGIWWVDNIPAGRTTVTITFLGANTDTTATVYEVSGLNSAGSFDTSSVGDNDSATTPISWTSNTTATLASASEIAIGITAQAAAITTITGPSAPWTNTALTSGSLKSLAGQNIVSATTALAYAGSTTHSGTADTATCIATFKAVSAVSVALTVAQETVTALAPAPAAGPLALSVAQVNEAARPPTPVINVSVALTVAQETVTALPPVPQMSGVTLPVAQVTEAAPAVTPTVGVILALPAAQVTLSAPSPSLGGSVVSLTVAQVTVAAPAPSVARSFPLPVAQETVTAPAPSLGGSVVALGLAAVTVAAPAPGLSIGKNVNLTAAAEAVAARPPTPSVNISLALTTARVTITANAPKVSRQLLISLASKAGTDDYGTAFPQGILATAGVIEGPTLVGSDAFFYNGTPAFGNLVQSITEADGTDQFGNAYIAGTTTYNSVSFWSAVQVSGGSVTWYTASGPGGPWTVEAGIGFAFNALTGGNLVLQGTNGTLQLPGGSIPQSLSGSIGTLPPDGNSGTGWVTGERAFMNNNWVNVCNNNFAAIVAALQAAGIAI